MVEDPARYAGVSRALGSARSSSSTRSCGTRRAYCERFRKRGYGEKPAGEPTPLKSQPPYDDERLDALKAIRVRFIDLAETGDESAARIVRAVDSMIAEIEKWLQPPGGVRRDQP